MCRLLAYLGVKPLLLSELIEKPKNSLISQSKESKEGVVNVNADGFGLAWYNKTIDNYPGIFKSIKPAWNDNNLSHISKKVESDCFLGHIRASTGGDVTFNNCHPFSYEEYSFAHNGIINNFNTIKRELVNSLEEDLFLSIKAQTDSEHLFFLIMNYLRLQEGVVDIQEAVKSALEWIVDKQKGLNSDCYSKLNTLTMNGNELVATRFSSKGQENLSLFYTTGVMTKTNNDSRNEGKTTGIIVASERLNDYKKKWIEIEPNTMLVAKCKEDQLEVTMEPIK